MTATLPIDQMIDLKRGTISREIFVSPEFYREELEKLFTRAWLFVGHESLIPKPGDFFVSRMGEESVILCRDTQGAVHVFLNSCRHRGMKVCRYEQGNTSLFVCPYHSWSYTTDGKLQGVPLYRALYEGTLNREEWSLIEVPKLAHVQGHGLGVVGPGGARLAGLSRQRGRPPRPGAGLPRRPPRRIGSHRRAQMGVPVELEVRGGEFPRRHLSQSVAPLGGHDRHRPQRATRPEGPARQRIQQGPARLGRPSRRPRHAQRADAERRSNTSRPTRNTRSSRSISATASTNGSAGSARRRGCCRSPATSSPTRRITAASRAACACGIRTARPRPRAGASSWSMPMRRPR